MFKIAVVDDDQIIRQGLSTILPWDQHGFQLIGTAADGEEGLHLISQHHPHVVISDINMPFMDGLAMAKVVKEKWPDIKIILLSGYEEFKYAQEAIRIKAYDYILKPIDSDVLLNKVIQAAEEWQDDQKNMMQIKDSKAVLQQKFLLRFLQNEIPEDQLPVEMNKVELNLTGSCFAVLCILTEKQTETERVKHICANILKDCQQFYFIQKDQKEMMIILSDSRLHYIQKKLPYRAEELRIRLKEICGTAATVAIGNVYRWAEGIPLSYQSAKTLMDMRFFLGIDRVLTIEDLQKSNYREKIDMAELEEELILKVKLGLARECQAILEKMNEQYFHKKFANIHESRFYIIQFTFLLFLEVKKQAAPLVLPNNLLYEAYKGFLQANTTIEIIAAFKGIVIQLAKLAKQHIKNKETSIVEKAMKYIEQHYANENLSLNMVAEAVHVSPAYLSNIFKTEKGINFSKFLLKTRMQKAMKLLRDSDLKAYEVAEKVGYSNPQYFSICFKKYTNHSPQDFKKLE